MLFLFIMLYSIDFVFISCDFFTIMNLFQKQKFYALIVKICFSLCEIFVN